MENNSKGADIMCKFIILKAVPSQLESMPSPTIPDKSLDEESDGHAAGAGGIQGPSPVIFTGYLSQDNGLWLDLA